ncbi:MAG: hypothetical protein JOZ10_05885, partial [Acidobacteria bacterium]|nr:hypothetical protein [Acidobacteriota bacterium]
MKNAHLRFGDLSYTKIFKTSSTHFKLPLDRFIGEPQAGSQMKAHLISVIGGDTQIAAVGAAIANRDWFNVEDAERGSWRTSLGANAETYRGSLPVDGLKRPLRHLVAVSEELAQLAAGKSTERTIIFDDAPAFVWAVLAHTHGLPGRREWADWIVSELKRLRAIKPLVGIGCSPLLVKGQKGLFMNAISRGVREEKLKFPE